jgi:hypothetical protein
MSETTVLADPGRLRTEVQALLRTQARALFDERYGIALSSVARWRPYHGADFQA